MQKVIFVNNFVINMKKDFKEQSEKRTRLPVFQRQICVAGGTVPDTELLNATGKDFYEHKWQEVMEICCRMPGGNFTVRHGM